MIPSVTFAGTRQPFCEKIKYKQILFSRKFSLSSVPLKIKATIKLHQGLQQALQTEGALWQHLHDLNVAIHNPNPDRTILMA